MLSKINEASTPEVGMPGVNERIIEAVARALCVAIGIPEESTVLDRSDGQTKIAWRTQIPKARAAIAAYEAALW
jgi:hypothetical protein